MRYLIQCCHANEYIDDQAWKKIDECSTAESFSDWILSPSSSLDIGTLVRLYSVTTEEQCKLYLVGNEAYVPMGPYTPHLRRHMWHYNTSSDDYARMHGWPEAWRCCENASWMLDAAIGLSDFMTLLRAAIVLAEGAYLHLPEVPKFSQFMDVIVAYTEGKADIDHVRSANVHAYDYRDDARMYSFAKIAQYLYESLNIRQSKIGYVPHHVAELMIDYDASLKKSADTLRRMVPLHDVLIKMV